MKIATLTLKAIEEQIRSDQGGKFRAYLRELMPEAEDAYRGQEDGRRGHLGASIIGRECPREIWYSFRWALIPNHSARLLRLFNRGHLEEPRMLALLKCIGAQVWSKTEDGKQFRAEFLPGHYGGSLDGIIKGIPEIPDVAVLGEFKTHNAKSFAKLVTDGVHFTKWEHVVQTNLYMGAYGLTYTLYLATNKNDDDLYAEILPFDKTIYLRYFQRGVEIIKASSPPPRIHKNSSWYKCKMCDFHSICHGNNPVSVSCRMCKFSSPQEGGGWACSKHGISLSDEAQKAACQHYAQIDNK